MKKMVFALAGNPNSGKTTLFNELTGSHYEVGNFAGVTVEKKVGICKYVYHEHAKRLDTHEHTSVHKHGEEHNHIEIIDLPGIYSLSPYSNEEVIARDYIMNEKPDLILNIVDATNLLRNLYLTTQLSEMGIPMIIALNMMDAVEQNGQKLDPRALEESLGIRVIPISASKGAGIQDLVTEALELITEKNYSPNFVEFPDHVEKKISELMRTESISRICAIKLLENEPWKKISDETEKSLKEYLKANDDLETLIASRRYAKIRGIVNKCLTSEGETIQDKRTEKIDDFATHRFLAIPIFIAIMFLIFQITFGSFGAMLSDVVDNLINVRFSSLVSNIMLYMGASPGISSLVVDGIISGVGGVVAFFPQIMLLFLFLSFMEDSGYMARTAFIMDRLFVKLGMSGKSFVPMIMGFGCSVPAAMSARTLENERDRRLTILLIPFMSCGAKMPVYAILSAAFFPNKSGLIIFSLYFLGIMLAILSGLIFSKTVLRGDPSPFILEFPPYRMPTLKSTFHHMWDKAKDFLVRAGTVLLVASIVIWFMQNFSLNLKMVSDSTDSIIGQLGRWISPIFKPCGFGTSEVSVSLISGVAAKEAIISSMSILYGAGDSRELISILSTALSPAGAYALLTFILLYVPCIAAMSAIKTEMNSNKLTVFSILYQLIIAWVVSFAVYHLLTFIL